jgi:hypothetical protein
MRTFPRGLIAPVWMAMSLFAVTAGWAVAAAPSIGRPAIYECAKLSRVEHRYRGRYVDALCSLQASPQELQAGEVNRYELEAGAGRGRPFTGQGTKAVLHAKTSLGDMMAECASSKESGRMVAPNLELGVRILWSGCKTFGSHVCTSPGAATGRIRTVRLRGEFGLLEGELGSVGVKLESEADPGGIVAEFKCGRPGFFAGKVHGELISLQQGDIGLIGTEFETVAEATERLGEQEFEAHRYIPLINILGWAGELGAIQAGERPAQVLAGEFCGEFIKAIIDKPCTPPTDLGLDQVSSIKGEGLGIFEA